MLTFEYHRQRILFDYTNDRSESFNVMLIQIW